MNMKLTLSYPKPVNKLVVPPPLGRFPRLYSWSLVLPPFCRIGVFKQSIDMRGDIRANGLFATHLTIGPQEDCVNQNMYRSPNWTWRIDVEVDVTTPKF